MLYPSEIRNYRDWLTMDIDLWRHYWFGMVNRGVMAQPYWWDEQWTISVQHTEKRTSTSILLHSRTSLQRWLKHSRNARQKLQHIRTERERRAPSQPPFKGLRVSGENNHANQPNLKRVLGRCDLVLLFVVAVFNLNVVPSIAANGGVTVWLWIVALLLFFWPQGIAVIELAHRYPGEGGVYLWAKEVFGDFHGFLSGWCYWTNNMLYVPTVMLYFVGVSVYVLGPSHQGLADNKIFAISHFTVLLAVLTWLNIVGLGVGKWINNLGAIGTGIAAAVLIGFGIVLWSRFGSTITAADFRIPADPRFVLNSFGVICFGLVGLELASVMGDEIREPAEDLARSSCMGRSSLWRALCRRHPDSADRSWEKRISVLQGIVQAVSQMASQVGLAWIVVPFALMLSLSIAGIGSAWMGGSARIPFVAGLDSYMPRG